MTNLGKLVAIVFMFLPAATQANQAAVKCVQLILFDVGYGPGPADGVITPRTKDSADRYVVYMSKHYDGWAMPALSSATSELWCKQLSAANPKYDSYLSEFYGAPILTISKVTVAPRQRVSVPFDVDILFRSSGEGAFLHPEACFSWDDRPSICSPFLGQNYNGSLTTKVSSPSQGTHKLNVSIGYETTSGKRIYSAQYTRDITLSP